MKVLSMADSVEARSLNGLSTQEVWTAFDRFTERLHRIPGDVLTITYQQGGRPPRVWQARRPKPYRPCFDRPPPPPPSPRVATLIYRSTDEKGSFSVVEQETEDNPFVMPSADLGIDIGKGRRLHFSPSSTRPGASWDQDGLHIQILNPKGLITREQIHAIAQSTE